ncbi:LysR family transcriptional regulator [Aureimonas frigidaquae]|uniref:LysR family transcriptional regulator n=1 Tax=Aureimonas frigidaquae TaxID=424757 RepID=A0A0P0Z1S0_9HYPH|nr:LysR substrate-binding domain-containing protein [Aureimonas frigidaquae]BAT27893.1 LysR family transcriptional regulator [Aureimonas frigidaquae]
MDLRQLRYFVEIADVGNFSRAAETLRIAQPSLSQQMRNLEDELGAELLVRHARGAALTELGRQFYDHARKILNGVDRAREAIQSRAGNPTGRVCVGLPTSAARNLSLPLYRALASRHPNIVLHMVEAMSGYLDDFVQAGRLDVALLYDHRAFETVAWTETMSEDLMLFVPRHSPLARRASISFDRVFDLPLVLPGRPHVLRGLVERLAARHDIVPAALDCDSLPAIARLVAEEGHCTIMPHFAFLSELERGEMAAVRIVDPTPSWRLSVVVSRRTMNPQGSDVVARCLADVIAGLVASGTWQARLKEGGSSAQTGPAPLSTLAATL